MAMQLTTIGLTLDLLPRQAYCASYCPREPVIGFCFERQRGWHAIGTDRRSSFASIPNGLAFTPPGCDIYSRSETGGEYLLLSGKGLCQVLAEAAATFAASDDQSRQYSDRIDPIAIAVAHRLRSLLTRTGSTTSAEVETDALELAAVAIDTAHADNGERAKTARSMTPLRLDRTLDFIEANIATDLTISRLADVAGLSRFHFARVFRASVGIPPHAYIMERRVATARRLLTRRNGQTDDFSSASIASACGFYDQSHMIRTFRRVLGATPGHFR